MVGAAPSFTEVHLVRALFVFSGGACGRKKLVRELGVGEGSVRTILKRLSGEGLISSTKLGQELSVKGKKKVESILKKFSKPAVFSSPDLSEGEQSLVVVYGAASRAGSGVALRDVALKAGADGAVLLVSEKGRLVFPGEGVWVRDYPTLAESLKDVSTRSGDVIVIGFAVNRALAEDGALAVALKLSS